MNTVVTIDFDIIMAPSIMFYNDKVPGVPWDDLLKDPHYQLLTIDANHYQKIVSYLTKCIKILPKENIHFIEDHGRIAHFITTPNSKVINIDHHHDLGYGKREDDDRPADMIHCANWAKILHDKGFIKSYLWVNNSNSSQPFSENNDNNYDWMTTKDFRELDIDELPIPDELILCLSEPWVPYAYRPLFYALMDLCNNFYNTHFDLMMGPYMM